MTPQHLPRYQDLPRNDDGVGSAWGLFGPDDSIGLMNLLTEAKAVEAASLVRRGKAFPLDLPIDFMTPPLFGRGLPSHTVMGNGWTMSDGPSRGLDDKLDGLYLQGTSQWDSLGHAGYDTDRFWNGRTTDEVRGGANTIDHLAAHGIITRGVLLDVAGVVAERGGPGASVAITVADLESARVAAGLEIRQGDILVIHTGFVDWYADQPQDVRSRLADKRTISAAGIEHSEAMAEYLWDLHIVTVASDTAAVEWLPSSREVGTSPFDYMHRILIGQFGMSLGELFRTGPLAADCAEDGVYEFMLTSAPLWVPRGIGSPPNAIAVK